MSERRGPSSRIDLPAGVTPGSGSDSFDRRFRLFCLAAGLLLSLFLITRTQLGGDQLSLLSRGWLLAERGELVPYGNPLSGGGYGPGPATSVLVALPLAIWEHHLAPVAFIWLTHLAAWLLLDRRLRGVLTESERAAFALVYWLNPWRVGSAAVLWNPNFLFLAGAIHLVTLWDSREHPRFGSSFVHMATLGIAIQLHPSVLLLGVTSAILAWRRAVRIHWAGAISGSVLAVATLYPWFVLYREDPGLLHGGGGFLFRALVLVQPLIKGLSYWLRYPSLLVPQESSQTDFSAIVGESADRWLSGGFAAFVVVAGALTAIAALAANRTFWKERRISGWLPAGPSGPREFVARYVTAAGLATLVVIASSPTTPQSWQLLPLFHAAAVPVALWVGTKLAAAGGDGRRRTRRLVVAAAGAAILISVATGFGARNFRCGGKNPMVYPLSDDSPMLEALRIQETCRFPTNVAGAGWPDGMPKQ